jgi:hypothetical protein
MDFAFKRKITVQFNLGPIMQSFLFSLPKPGKPFSRNPTISKSFEKLVLML